MLILFFMFQFRVVILILILGNSLSNFIYAQSNTPSKKEIRLIAKKAVNYRSNALKTIEF